MITLQTWLTRKIEEKGIGISQLSFETGLSRTIIYFYMSGVNQPRRDNLKKICDVLGADIEEAMALCTTKKLGRPFGSSKKWGQITPAETILENINTDNSNGINTISEYTQV